MEFDAAEKLFVELGAIPDLERVRSLRPGKTNRVADLLTPREREMLVMMADGDSNREITGHLDLSPKTVNRHVGNIFNKLGVSSRAAAVAKGLKTGLICPAQEWVKRPIQTNSGMGCSQDELLWRRAWAPFRMHTRTEKKPWVP